MSSGDGTIASVSSENLRFQRIIAVLGVTLMLIKFAAWAITSSVSVLTDALESIVNVVAAFVGLYALYLSARPRDRSHPYGHGKVELISSSVEGMMILVAGIVIMFEAVNSIMHPHELTSMDIGLVLLVIAAVANFIVGYMAINKGRRNRSMALVASGKHLCSDTFSSIGIIAGLGVMLLLSGMGYDVNWIDSAIAAVFGAIIMVTGVRVVKESMDGVMDRADEKTVDEIITLINCVRHDHWVDLHNLRVTKYGPILHIDLHMMFPKDMTVEQQSVEIDEVYEAVRRKYGDDFDITIMGEPCDETMCRHCTMECVHRKEAFVSVYDWTAVTATDRDEHHDSADVDH